MIVLRNYTGITEEDDEDPWWQLWKRLQENATTEESDGDEG